MSDKVLADIMRRIINTTQCDDDRGNAYVNFGHHYERPFITVDLHLDLTEAELAAVVAAEVPR